MDKDVYKISTLSGRQNKIRQTSYCIPRWITYTRITVLRFFPALLMICFHTFPTPQGAWVVDDAG